MEKLFHPRSIAIIGVSESEDNLGRAIVNNLMGFDFRGLVFNVGPRGGIYAGRRIYHSVEDIPDAVDLAVILTPAKTVPDILEACGRKGIRRAVIESAGFGEYSEAGKELEARIIEIAKKYDIRFVGPNCLGIMNLANGMAVQFTPMRPIYQRGGISIITQSGGVGHSYLNLCYSENLGVAKFASIGNKLNIDENDLLEYLLEDPETKIIVMYLEGIKDGHRLIEIARGSTKPILMHKSNVGVLAQKIASSHTASLASDDAVLDAVLDQIGIVRVDSMHSLANYLKILHMPKIEGNRLAILSRSGGHAIIATDACEKYGFDLVNFPPEFLTEIEKHFRASVIKLTNPLDLGDLFDLDFYMKIFELALKINDVDGIVFLHTYVSATEREGSRELMDRIQDLSHKYGKPIVISVSSDDAELSYLRENYDFQVFTSPEDAIKGLRLLRDYDYEWTYTPPQLAEGGIERKKARGFIEKASAEKRSLLLHEAFDVISAYDLPTSDGGFAADAESAVDLAATIGYPVACKLVSRDLTHKTDVGGVLLNLQSADELTAAIVTMKNKIETEYPGNSFDGVYLQPMADRGIELILGAKRDRQFGPVVLLGFGGIFVEIFRKSTIHLAPVDQPGAEKMIRELPGAELLAGARRLQPYDVKALAEAISKISRLIEENAEINEIDVNPIILYPEGKGALAIDARIILADEQ